MNRLALVALIILAACSGGSSADEPDSTAAARAVAAPLDAAVIISNQGGAMEGHTPLGFAGSGTGLFTGDNLNDGFPDGEGIQLLLTFDLPAEAPGMEAAILRSDALTVRGEPFSDLGDLLAEPVTYEEFGPSLFELRAVGEPVICERLDDDSVECDVTSAVASTVVDGRSQFRLRFERAGDSDGATDLAMFFLTDSNTNEPGIFTLELS